MMHRRTGRRGTTILETLAALLVLSSTVLLASAIFPAGGTLRHRSHTYTRAATIVQRKLEQIRRMPYEDLNYLELQAQGIVEPKPQGGYCFDTIELLSQHFGGATSDVTLTNVAPDLLRVDVTLEWEGARRGQSRVDATTFVAGKLAWRE
jgi:Tfp pilus assembly protein PilV